MAKNIVICCDGTWNAPNFLEGTNVWKIYNFLEDGYNKKAKDVRQVRYYDTGVGTKGPIDKLTGGISGKGLVDNIFEAYRFVCSHYQKGDKLYILGFSRGAYTARALAGVMYDGGIVTGDFTCTHENYKQHSHNCFDSQIITEHNDKFDISKMCPKCLALNKAIDEIKVIFKKHKSDTYIELKKQAKKKPVMQPGLTDVKIESKKLLDKINEQTDYKSILPTIETEKGPEVEQFIHFIGVWDTVSALGIPSLDDLVKNRDSIGVKLLNRFYNFFVKSSQRQYAFINNQLTPIVKNAYHALAIDEQRSLFKPVLWEDKILPNQCIQQKWFAGAHSNIGGGYADHTLSDISLLWILQKGGDDGLLYNTDYTKFIHPSYSGLAHLSHRESFYRFLKSSERVLPKNKSIHPTVFRRMSCGLRYSPQNIFKR